MLEKDLDMTLEAKGISEELDAAHELTSKPEELKKEDKSKKKKVKKEKKRSNKKKSLILLILVGILILTWGIYFGLKYFREKALVDVSKELTEAALKLNEDVSIEIKDSKIVSATKVTIKNKLPKTATINVVDGEIEYIVGDGRYCNVKNFFDEKAKVVRKKDCKLNEPGSEYIIKTASKEHLFTVDEEDSLLKDEYYYAGANPDNFIIFAGSCYRILSVQENGNIKAIFSGYIKGNTCKDVQLGYTVIETSIFGKNNNFLDEENNLRLTLEEYVSKGNAIKKIIINKNEFNKLASENWYIGSVARDIKDLETIVKAEINQKDEKELITFNGKIGLISVSDFIKASSSEECVNMKSANNNPDYPCRENNFLYEEGYPYWTINALSNSSMKAWVVSGLGSLIPYDTDNESVYIRPAILIRGSNHIIGKGTVNNPYIVK